MIFLPERSVDRLGLAALCAVVTVAFVIGTGPALASNDESVQIGETSTATGRYICSPAGFGQMSRCYQR